MTELRRPTIADLDALGTALRTTVPPAFEDMNGHVNVRHHYGLHMDGAEGAFVDDLGLDESWLERTGQSSFSVEHHLQFSSEILVGDDVSVHLRVLGRSRKAIHTMTILYDRTRDEVASTLESLELYVDLTTRRTTPMPDELAKLLDALVDEHAGLPWDLPRRLALH